MGAAIAYPGLGSLWAGATLDGRFYSAVGAIAINAAVRKIPFYNIPFNYDLNTYLFQNNVVYTKHEASGSSYEITTDTTTGNINATEYNRVDGYISGCLGSPEKTIWLGF